MNSPDERITHSVKEMREAGACFYTPPDELRPELHRMGEP